MLNANHMFKVEIIICYEFWDTAIFTTITRTRYNEFADGLWHINTHFFIFFSSAFDFANCTTCSINMYCSISRCSSTDKPCSAFLANK